MLTKIIIYYFNAKVNILQRETKQYILRPEMLKLTEKGVGIS